MGYNIIGDGMKRVFETIILLAVIILLFQIISLIFKNGHKANYVISVNDKNFSINEVYKDGYYHIAIYENNYRFNLYLKDNYSKSKKIIKDIIYTTGDMECIYPVTSKKDLNIVCSGGTTVHSYPAVSTKPLVTAFVAELKNKGYKNLSWEKSNPTQDGKISYYQEYLDNYYLYIWKYNGFYTLRNKVPSSYDMFNRDIYNNDLGIVYKNKYIVADYSKKYDFDSLMIFDMTNDTFKKVNFDTKLSYNSYYNGIVKDKLYLADPTNLLQYEINLKNHKAKLIGSKDLNGLYYDKGSWGTINIYDFTKDKLKFKYYDIPDMFNESNVIVEAYKSNDVYFYVKNDGIYMYDAISDMSKQLFVVNNVKAPQVSYGNLYYIVDDTLYVYSDKVGTLPLIKNNEFKFNTNNIYGVYIK